MLVFVGGLALINFRSVSLVYHSCTGFHLGANSKQMFGLKAVNVWSKSRDIYRLQNVTVSAEGDASHTGVAGIPLAA